jgi:O-antigen/teichoic acid export membrane protein
MNGIDSGKSQPSVSVPPSPPPFLKAAIRRAAVLFSGSTLTAVLALLQNILVVRALGAEQYGVWGLGVSLAALAFGFLGFRTHDALNRSLVRIEAAVEVNVTAGCVVAAALLVEFATAAITATILIAALPFIIPSLTANAAATVVFTTNILAMLLMAQDKVFQGITRHADATHLIPVVNLIAGGSRLVVTAALFLASQLDLKALAYSNLGVSLLTFAMHAHLLRRLLRSSLGLHMRDLKVGLVFDRWQDLRGFRSMLSVTFLSSSASTIFKQADVLLLGLWRDDQAVGLYRLAKSLALTLQNMGSSLAFALYDDFTKLVTSRNLFALQIALRKLSKILAVIVPLAAFGILVAPYAVALIYGYGLSGAVLSLQILIVASSVMIGLSWTFPLLISLDGEATYLRIIFTGTLVQVLLSIALLPITDSIIPMALITAGSWIGVFLTLLLACLLHMKSRIASARQSLG